MGGMRRVRPLLWWVVVVAVGCAHRPAPAPERPASPPPPEEPAPHGARGAAQPVLLPWQIVDPRSGAILDEDALAARLRAARVILVAEQHPNPHDHAAQLEVLKRVHALDRSVALGLEMLPAPAQPLLDQYLAGTLDEEDFQKAVDWEHAWGFPFGLYAPVLRFCKAHGLRVYALNAPRALVRAVSKGGLDQLAEAERAQLPALDPGPAAHREMVREAFGAHGRGRFNDARFERFYAAQLVWDETMAEGAARVLRGDGAPRRVVLLAGEGHTRPYAVPLRIERRGAGPCLTVVPLFADEVDDARADQVADLLWVHQVP